MARALNHNIKRTHMTIADIVRETGIPRSTLTDHPEVLRRLEARAPVGRRKYARVLVERWMHDESVVRIGRGARVSA